VGKYGSQVQSLLNKASALEIETICPLHGFVWRKNIGEIASKYALWSAYEPEERGVMIAYASVYGNTENAAEILSCKLRENGVKTAMYDVSVTSASEIVSAAFKWSHLAFASTTYNAGIFVAMEAVICDLAAHNIQKRTVGIIENGSWAATSGGLIREKLEKCKNITFLENKITIKSGLKAAQLAEIEAMAAAFAADFAPPPAANAVSTAAGVIDTDAMFKLSYGLFVLTAKDNGKDNGCIINTAAQLTLDPLQISITVNKSNYTHDMIIKTNEFNISVLAENAPFGVFERFGFVSGRAADKFGGSGYKARTKNGIKYVTDYANCVISAKVRESLDCGTHTLFIAEVTEAVVLSNEPSVTYRYYFDNIKPKPQTKKDRKPGYVCKICGYVYEGGDLPADFVCPLCKHGASDFEKNN